MQPRYEYEEDGGEFYCEVQCTLTAAPTLTHLSVCSCVCLVSTSWGAGRLGTKKRRRGKQPRCFATFSLKRGSLIGGNLQAEVEEGAKI